MEGALHSGLDRKVASQKVKFVDGMRKNKKRSCSKPYHKPWPRFSKLLRSCHITILNVCTWVHHNHYHEKYYWTPELMSQSSQWNLLNKTQGNGSLWYHLLYDFVGKPLKLEWDGPAATRSSLRYWVSSNSYLQGHLKSISWVSNS